MTVQKLLQKLLLHYLCGYILPHTLIFHPRFSPQRNNEDGGGGGGGGRNRFWLASHYFVSQLFKEILFVLSMGYMYA